MILIKRKSCKREEILKNYPDAIIFDVTMSGAMNKLSPLYPHGDIPVPFTTNAVSMTVEGTWQGLKVYEFEGIDTSLFREEEERKLKRTSSTKGKYKGHSKGTRGVGKIEILTGNDAIKQIYVPAYKWVLENKCRKIVEKIKELSKERTVILLDDKVVANVDKATKIISHAALIKAYVEDEI